MKTICPSAVSEIQLVGQSDIAQWSARLAILADLTGYIELLSIHPYICLLYLSGWVK